MYEAAGGEALGLSSAVHSFTDPDAYAATIRQTTARLTVTRRGRFTAQIIRIDLHRLWMQRFSESLPRVLHTNSLGGRAVISFRTQPGPDLSWGGFDLQPAQFIRHVVGGGSYQHSTGATGIGAMSLPLEDMASAASVIAGCDLALPRDALLIIPRAASMAKLQRLHAAAGHLAETAPEVIAHPEAARGLEQALIEAMVDCLTAGQPPQIVRANGIDICYEIFGDASARADAADHGARRPDDPVGRRVLPSSSRRAAFASSASTTATSASRAISPAASRMTLAGIAEAAISENPGHSALQAARHGARTPSG